MDPKRSELDGPATTGAEAFLPVQAFLSLWLVMLAFFIVLATVSRPEAGRASQAIASVRAAFTSDVPLGSVTGEATSLFVEAERSLRDRVGRLLEADLPLPSRRDATSGQIAADLPLETMFDGPALTPAGEALVRRVAALLASPPEGLAYGVTVTVPPGEAAQARATRLAAGLIAAGTLPAWIRAGIEPGLGTLRLAFAVRPAGGAAAVMP